ncbi:MAG: energy-coupling factor transporter ATPase [Planctomycetota bacterium]
MTAIEIKDLTFTYRGADTPALQDVSLRIEPGEFVVLMGATGAGKSSLVRCLNNIIPKFYPGDLSGRVTFFGEDRTNWRTSDFAGAVGMVFQDFECQLFSTNAALEVAFGMENLGLPCDEMRRRLQDSLETVGLPGVEDRDPTTLSGGQKQRLAIASVLAMRPRILILDEPTTDLDPVGKRRIFEIVDRLSEEVGLTILMIEHETDYARNADRIVLVDGGRIVGQGPPSRILADGPLLQRHSVRPTDLIRVCSALHIADPPASVEETTHRLTAQDIALNKERAEALTQGDRRRSEGYGPEIIEVKNLRHQYPGHVEALKGVSLAIREGEFVAVLGQNGSGKTTLVKHLNGLLAASGGSVALDGKDVSKWTASSLGREVGYVFQDPDHQIFAATVREEVAFGPANFGYAKKEVEEMTARALDAVGLIGCEDRDPFALTKGERQRVAVASILASDPRVLILDEPTTGLDYAQQRRMMDLVRKLNEDGRTIIIITHSMWVAAEYAHRAVVMADGLIVADGTVREIFSNREALDTASLIAPPVVQLSQQLGAVLLSVDEFLQCIAGEA